MLIQVEVDFRLAQEDDLPALEWMGLFTPHREIIARTFEAQEQGEAAMLLGIGGGFPLGQAWIDFLPRYPRIWAVRVFPPLQGAGLGSRLMAEAESLAASRGADAVEVGVEHDNPGARRLYERLGYRAADEELEKVSYEFEGETMEMTVEQVILRKGVSDA